MLHEGKKSLLMLHVHMHLNTSDWIQLCDVTIYIYASRKYARSKECFNMSNLRGVNDLLIPNMPMQAYYMLPNVSFPKICCSALCCPCLSVEVSFSLDVILLVRIFSMMLKYLFIKCISRRFW